MSVSNNLKPLAWIREGTCIVITSHKFTSYGYVDIRRGSDRDLLHRTVLRRRMKRQGRELNLSALHECDNRACVNPDHLFEGTQTDNVMDMLRKGRGAHPPPPPGLKGEEKIEAKLTDKAIREIRASRDIQTALARKYGVNQSTISSVKTFKTWRHVK